MICLVRHGEAAATWGQVPGDPGLSDLGQQQAESVAQQLMGGGFRYIFASPMKRCQETSAPFARLSGLAVTTSRAVSEVPTPDGLDDRVAWLQGFMAGTWETAPGIVLDWRDALIQQIETLPDNTVVFSHFVAINAVASHFEKSDQVMVFRPGHCSVTRLERSGSGMVIAERGSESATKVL